jgi:hypothetical protein
MPKQLEWRLYLKQKDLRTRKMLLNNKPDKKEKLKKQLIKRLKKLRPKK